MKLKELITTDLNLDITGVTDDSRLVKEGYIFVATKGYNVDHYDYIEDAINKGAIFIVADRAIKNNIPHIIVDNLDECYRELCKKFYKLDLSRLNLIGITGTDGKTTTTTLVKELLKDCAYLGTNGLTIGDKTISTSNTTPCISELYRDLSLVKENKVDTVSMEVSSEALLHKRVDGFLFDLGVSSPQLDEKERGFSYHEDALLDMRMDRDNPLSASIVVNTYTKEQLAHIFKVYGEDKFANNIAKKIVEYREKKKIETTLELVEIIKTAVPMKFRKDKHPARQIFQAIRIEVNKELDVLEPALSQALELLNIGGRVVVITFHSLEDRIVKNYFKSKTEVDKAVKGMPNIPDEYLPDFKLVVNKAIEPSKEELENNPRARSAKLRVIERIK